MHAADVAIAGGAAAVGTLIAVLLRPPRGRTLPAVWPAWTTPAVAIVCALCWLVMAVTARHYFVDVPRWDVWDVVDLVERHYGGTLTIGDLLRPHNEHRPVTARVVILPNVVWFHWNHWIDFAVLMAVAAGPLAVMARYVAWTASQHQRVSPAALVPIAVVGCSLTQWENLLRGYHVHIVMAVVATVAGLLWLTTGRTSWMRLVAAAVAGIVAALSFGSGVLLWPLGLVAIVVRRGSAWLRRAGVWCALGASVIVLYRTGMPGRPGYSEVSIGSAVELLRVAVATLVGLVMPVAYVPEVFATPVSPAQVVVVAVPAAAAVGGLLLVWRRWQHDAHGEQAWLFPALLMAFGVGALILASLGRAAGGLYALTASRYIVHATCFWFGLILLLAMRGEGEGRRWHNVTVGWLVVLTLAAAVSWPCALPFMERDRASGRAAREALLRGAVGEAAVVLYPEPFALERKRRVLEAHQLSIYRPGARR